MTVQQDRPTSTPTAAGAAVRLPEQRRPDAVPAPVPAPVAERPAHLRGWGSEHDRTMARWLAVFMLSVGLYGALFVWLGTRVWG